MKSLILIAPLFLVGCGLCPTKIEIREIKVPVIQVPAPPETVKPKLETELASVEKDGFDGYVKMLEADFIRIKAYTQNLENVINTYVDLAKKTKDNLNVN